MTFDALRFASEWASAWNARDLGRVLAHFEESVTFSTPKAVDTVGRPTVTGKAALRAYWETALSRITSLTFTVDRVIWDPVGREIGIVYDREVNGSRDRALELLRLDDSGRVVSGEVFYGVVPTA